MKTTQVSFVKLSILMLSSLPFSAIAYDGEYMKHIINKYNHSFGVIIEKVEPTIPKMESLFDFIKSLFKPNPFSLTELSDHESRELTFKATETNIYNAQSVISTVTADKIELVNGAGKSNNDHIMSRITTIADRENNITDMLQTKSGKAVLVKTISQPHTDVNALIKKQHIIKTCTENKDLLLNLTATLKNMGRTENNFLSCYKETDIIDPEMLKNVYWQLPIFTQLNKSTEGLETHVRLNNTLTGMTLLSEPLLIAEYGWVVQIWSKVLWGEDLTYGQGCARVLNFIRNHPGIFLPMAGKFTYDKLAVLGQAKLKKNIANLVQTQLIGAANYVNGAKKLYSVVAKNPTIAAHFDSLSALKALAQPSKEHSAEFNELVQLLGTDTFRGEASFFSITGRVLRAHTLMRTESVQKEFAGIVNAIGELDMYVALAHKMNSTAGSDARYCFVAFDTTSNTPYLKANGLWNIFVNENKAVTNTIELGADKPRNIVLSGPNTGGKSTIAKAVLANTILAQTLGIAAAESMTITPFGNLDCYMNMTDDTASGVSGLKAEVNRAKEIIERIRSNSNTFTLILLDEIFTATSPDQAEKLAVSFISKLSEQANCLFINPAHFEGIIQFAAQSKDCRNCSMGVIVDKQGKVAKYTYKLVEGRSHVKNAEQVAQEGLAVW